MKTFGVIAILSLLAFGGISLSTAIDNTPAAAQTPIVKPTDSATTKPKLSLKIVKLGSSDLFQITLTNNGDKAVSHISARLDDGSDQRFIPVLEPGKSYTWTAPANVTNHATVNIYEPGNADPVIQQPLLSN